MAQCWQGIHTYLILSKDTGHMCLGKIIIMPILLFLGFLVVFLVCFFWGGVFFVVFLFLVLFCFILFLFWCFVFCFFLMNLIPLSFKTHNLLLMEFLGAKGCVLFGYMYVGYVKAGGIYGGFHVETRSNYSPCVTEKQHSNRFLYSVTHI